MSQFDLQNGRYWKHHQPSQFIHEPRRPRHDESLSGVLGALRSVHIIGQSTASSR
jgi:hypothetical protein